VTDIQFDDFDRELDALLQLPRFSPSPGFSESVMARVNVFAPKAVAKPVYAPARLTPLEALTKWIPQSRPARYAAATVAGSLSLAVSAVTVIGLAKLDLVTFVGSIAIDRMKVGLSVWTASLAHGLFGDTAMNYLTTGLSGQSALAMAGFGAGLLVTVVGLRSAASLSTNRIR
jgi:hypothetical protein